MTDDIRALRDDIAYLRTLAEEGRGSGRTGGAIIFAAGLIFAMGSVVQWASLSGLVSNATALIAWAVGTALFFAILFTLKHRSRGEAASGGFRAIGIAWQGVGFAIMTLMVSIGVAVGRSGDGLLAGLLPSIIFALYGSAWMVAGAVSGKRWVTLTAFGSFAMAIVCAFGIGQAVDYLIYAAGLLLLAALPGFVLMRAKPKA